MSSVPASICMNTFPALTSTDCQPATSTFPGVGTARTSMHKLELRMHEIERGKNLLYRTLYDGKWECEPGLADLQLVECRPGQLLDEAQMRPVGAFRGEYRLRLDAVLEAGMCWRLPLGLVAHLAEASPHLELEELPGFDAASVVDREDLDCNVSFVQAASRAQR